MIVKDRKKGTRSDHPIALFQNDRDQITDRQKTIAIVIGDHLIAIV